MNDAGAQVLDNWAALNHESQDSTPPDSKCTAIAVRVLIAFVCTQLSVPSDSWLLPRTAHFAASLLHSVSASFTCPQVLPIPFFSFPHKRVSLRCRSSCPHAARVFNFSPFCNLWCVPLHILSRLSKVSIAFAPLSRRFSAFVFVAFAAARFSQKEKHD
jgi:hypothetical protein